MAGEINRLIIALLAEFSLKTDDALQSES